MRVKTEMLMVRLSPKTKFALDLISRRRQMTMSQVVERELERLIQDPRGDLLVVEKPGENVKVLDVTWHDDALLRFLKIAENFPSLLRPMELSIWNLINANPNKFFHEVRMETPEGIIAARKEIDVDRIRRDWENLAKAAASGPSRGSGLDSLENQSRLDNAAESGSMSV
jgi:hypothetical protein